MVCTPEILITLVCYTVRFLLEYPKYLESVHTPLYFWVCQVGCIVEGCVRMFATVMVIKSLANFAVQCTVIDFFAVVYGMV